MKRPTHQEIRLAIVFAAATVLLGGLVGTCGSPLTQLERAPAVDLTDEPTAQGPYQPWFTEALELESYREPVLLPTGDTVYQGRRLEPAKDMASAMKEAAAYGHMMANPEWYQPTPDSAAHWRDLMLMGALDITYQDIPDGTPCDPAALALFASSGKTMREFLPPIQEDTFWGMDEFESFLFDAASGWGANELYVQALMQGNDTRAALLLDARDRFAQEQRLSFRAYLGQAPDGDLYQFAYDIAVALEAE